ncbi:putative basic amino acid antiporter YfcC [Salmonella enterica subsp. salamae]|uniref:Putative basic amino acid antiporter YfcC n=2 Tax=Salmonella enterica TaxID=28901 RepID=A0A8F7YG93_SALER|nr:putative basic amino acid antiporter YfcC [Salmonella enterica]EAA4081737.1 putative basic amino acid antiporter YfcC [Salmonella enterica subsp. salamae serovar Sofia]ECI2507808.1 putative basic amino acid antiporter YfcC [Salmonella enterica subsp. enterica serovar Paratyphi B]EDS8303373.1 putative basic amino acid antiporter YfcC [Salmonella enterica subsp. enterica serovar Java]EDT7497994.1 putative basic amino acid antiporter YfcC [Salmonella enterica subsp. enterica serovar Schleisshei
MSVVTESKPARKWAMPDTLVIIFFVAILTSIATWVVPVGMFDSQEMQYQVDGQTKTRKVVDPHSFRIVTNEAGEAQYHRVQFFTTGDERPGLMNFPFEGLTSGSKFGTAVGIIMFMLVIGGAFGIVMRTGTVDNGILALIRHTRGNEVLFIPVLFVLFSLGGAVFGMGEEAVAFAIIIAPLMVRLGYDSITTVLVTYIATQIGFASSWMNPFCVVVAQGIAGVPVLSGSGLRIVVWIVATLIGLVFTLVYASRVKKNPQLSRVHESDRYFREQQDEVVQRPFTFGDWLVLLVLTGVMIWVVWGVIVHAWFIPEIASQFFTMGVVIGLIGVIFRLNGMTVNVMASSFTEGARMMIAPALLVGFAKGILLLVGNGEAGEPSVLNTLLNSIAHGISGLNNAIAAWFMLLFQAVFNFFVTSGSGQAALTMPLLAPLGDLVGVNRQVTVLAFQFGDGFSHIIYPTSASLMATLGVCRVDFRNWLKVGASLLGLLFIMSSVVVIGAQMMGYH